MAPHLEQRNASFMPAGFLLLRLCPPPRGNSSKKRPLLSGQQLEVLILTWQRRRRQTSGNNCLDNSKLEDRGQGTKEQTKCKIKRLAGERSASGKIELQEKPTDLEWKNRTRNERERAKVHESLLRKVKITGFEASEVGKSLGAVRERLKIRFEHAYFEINRPSIAPRMCVARGEPNHASRVWPKNAPKIIQIYQDLSSQ
ncbi:hypothetical protein B0H14DRAFT_2637036 [Mycena olivaceomarginata]|nr:hypothetical protein B0H14DRAFT_2637036 [Mycena olivaceomarginata]